MKNIHTPEHAPKMIIFDYGHSLGYEHGFSDLAGAEAVLKHASSNPRGVTAQAIGELATRLYAMGKPAREHDMEIHNHMVDHFVYEYLGVETGMTDSEREKVFWDAASPAIAMPNAAMLLDYLAEKGIRTAVISNISFGGETLRDRLSRILPNNAFEFVIASSDYGVRKPHPLIFELALNKAGILAADAWYCGDSPVFDVDGAASAGVFPVWYHSTKDCYYRPADDPAKPNVPHLYIRDWAELTVILDKLHP